MSLATAAVLATAGMAKMAARDSGGYAVLGVGELAVGTAILIPASRPLGLTAAILLGLAFTMYTGLDSRRPCRCFGAALETNSRLARVFRAMSVFLFASVGFACWLTSRGAANSDASWPYSAIITGVLLAALVVLVPPVVGSDAGRASAQARRAWR